MGVHLIYEPNQPQALISITQEAKMVPTEPTSGSRGTAHFLGGLLEVLLDFVLHIWEDFTIDN